MKLSKVLLTTLMTAFCLSAPGYSQFSRYGCWGGVPNASFADDKTYLLLQAYSDTDRYTGVTENGSLTLFGSQCAKDSSWTRQGWTWINGEFSYTVYWRPADPEFARLVVKNSGVTILNRLLNYTAE